DAIRTQAAKKNYKFEK
ncbi:MAG: hypothetical protein QG657_4191, partial [Acidobacteriota bacterium]|nr:hypothetical protein [Acidobacteriota bacterium]